MQQKNENSENKNNTRIETYFMTLSEAAKLSGYTPEHLNLLCRKGVLRAKKFGRNWETTQEWLNEFLFVAKSDLKKKYKRRKKVALKSESVSENSNSKSGYLAENEKKVFPEEAGKNAVAPKIEKENTFKLEESEKKEAGENKFSLTRMMLDLSLAAFVSFLIFFSISFIRYVRTENYIAEKNIPENISEDVFLSSDNSGRIAGEEKVKGETTQDGTVDQANANSISTSENFKMKEISFGGVLLASANGENLETEISDVKSEVFTTKDGKQSQILISWKTNKETISEISYSKSDNRNPKTLAEKDFGFNHSVVLSKLDLAATYVYQIKARDRWGNVISSERFGIYSGSKVVSVFDLIFKSINETFSWAIKK